MAPPAKKKKLSPNTAASESSRGVNKFRTPFHESRYKELISKKKIVLERAFILEGDQFVEIQEMIKRRGWNKLVSFPKPVSELLVKEFFANACEEAEFKKKKDGEEEDDNQNEDQKFISYVRGKQVVYDPKTLNELFGLEDFPHCDFAASVKADADTDYDDILRTLCIAGADRVSGKTEKLKKLRTVDLNSEAKGWASFVLHTLLPCSNVSEVNETRAKLVVSILKGENINVGRLLAHHLHETAKNSKLAGYLNHPALIGLLCEKVRVKAKQNEPMVDPASPITSSWIKKYSVQAPLIPPPLPEPPTVFPALTPPPEVHQEPLQEHSMEERLHRMETLLNEMMEKQKEMREEQKEMREEQKEIRAIQQHIIAMLQILREDLNLSRQPQGGESGVGAGAEDLGGPLSS